MKQDAVVIASQMQSAASDPASSVFVSASAGSGKTKLLIDRLLRLMLPRMMDDGTLYPGTVPGRILCLTFTKAAAAEMSVRLQTRLGSWASMPDQRLDKELRALQIPASEETRSAARALFAHVLDLPGGMRIGTIHAFCQSLLRRFPLEAAMNPHFALMEETDAGLFLNEAVETGLNLLSADVIAALSSRTSLSDFTGLLSALRHDARTKPVLERVSTDPESVRHGLLRMLRVPRGMWTGDLVAMACAVQETEPELRNALMELGREKTKTAQEKSAQMLEWLSLDPVLRAREWAAWKTLFLTGEGEPRKNAGLRGNIIKDRADIIETLAKEAQRIIAVDEVGRARELVDLTLALLKAAAPVLTRFNTQKTIRGFVEYDDLISRTLGLLGEPGAAWVLYKLDGGIDHLLLDEVQDTSRSQWQIAGGLTEEFFAGEGARDLDGVPRTVFAVGDYKQSIYGFQGADPDAFREWRRIFEQRVNAAGGLWREPELNVSFRSTSPVLQLVDSVFSDPVAGRGVAEDGRGMPPHVSARARQGGRVELWPLVSSVLDDDDVSPWAAPKHGGGQKSAQQRLADTLARYIAEALGAPSESGKTPLTPGDILILVPRRSAFVRALIRALKSADVPVATLVRTGLADQLAVRDLMALCDALLLPQDDLTLACVLTSPLGGLDDDSLMALVMGRRDKMPLWAVLRERHAERLEWKNAWKMLNGLFGRVDYAAPYTLLSAALGEYGGRARLLARLGPEAAEPVDELLSAALRYEESHPPSLQGFLHWLRHSDESVKREPEAAGNAVRVMTAHGSKGLQARLVILPDTTGTPRADASLFWRRDGVLNLELPLLAPRENMMTEAGRALQAAYKQAAAEEYNRLLYVALTRAADRLIVCGWEPKRGVPEESWYASVSRGFERLDVQRVAPPDDWEGETLLLEEEAEAAVPSGSVPSKISVSASLPAWVGSAPDWRAVPPREEPAPMRPLAPTRPEGAAFGVMPAMRSPLEVASVTPARARASALRRGTLVHSLFQYLPERRPEEWTDVGYRWLMQPGHGLKEAEAAGLVARVIEVMGLPALAPLFAAEGRAEQRLAGEIRGQVISGQVDRLRVLPDEILVCDFKTGRHPPSEIEQVPVPYLRQMAAYCALLQGIWPGRPIRCSLIWTETVTVMELPEYLLERYVPG